MIWNRAVLTLIVVSAALGAGAAPARTLQGRGNLPILASASETGSTRSQLKSYKDWKAEKVQSATAQVESTRAQVKSLKARYPKSAGLQTAIQNLEQQLAQEEWNREVATDLSVTDYLALYLAQNASPGKLTEAASKLTPDETAQVLEAYIRTMGSFPSDSKGSLPIHALQGR